MRVSSIVDGATKHRAIPWIVCRTAFALGFHVAVDSHFHRAWGDSHRGNLLEAVGPELLLGDAAPSRFLLAPLGVCPLACPLARRTACLARVSLVFLCGRMVPA